MKSVKKIGLMMLCSIFLYLLSQEIFSRIGTTNNIERKEYERSAPKAFMVDRCWETRDSSDSYSFMMLFNEDSTVSYVEKGSPESMDVYEFTVLEDGSIMFYNDDIEFHWMINLLTDSLLSFQSGPEVYKLYPANPMKCIDEWGNDNN